MKETERKIFLFLQKLLVKRRGFTLVEILVASFLLIAIISALFLLLNTGQFINQTGSLKLELISEVRNVIELLMRDLRQTFAYEIRNNQPASNHLKFRVCLGHDGTNILLSNRYIEYIYDNITHSLTRIDYNFDPERRWTYNDIVVSDPDKEPFDLTELNNNKIILTIRVSKEKFFSPPIKETFISEVKLRNE
ncbi:MAG: hypothetical protein NC900_02200 [Candidatus Omnitrophica bacterium]|nr:hypothetical protein [Candidatus Omnitrophota bacterium]